MNGFLDFWSSYGFNASLAILTVGIVLFFLNILSSRNDRATLFNIQQKDEEEGVVVKKKGFSFNPFATLRDKIHLGFVFKANDKMEKIIYYSILSTELFLIISFIGTQKYLLAVLLPIILHYLSIKAIEGWTRNVHDLIQEELPTAIRQFVKVMTKTSDLRIVTYEAGKTMKEPLREMFLDSSRKMANEPPEEVLMNLADGLQNSWIHAFIFILSSQKESTRKKDVVKNLSILAEMIDQQNRVAEKAVVEKKGMVLLNWSLAGASLLGFVANMIWVEGTYAFYFHSMGGMMAMLFGFVGLCMTAIVNITLSKKTI